MPAQLDMLHKATEVAGIHILQLLEDAGVAVLCVAANMGMTAQSRGCSGSGPHAACG